MSSPTEKLAQSSGFGNSCGTLKSPSKYSTLTTSSFEASAGETNAKSDMKPRSINNYFDNDQQLEQFQPQVLEMFEKCFLYQKPIDWCLPPANQLFTEYFQLDTLQELKIKLNQFKSKLNDYDIENWSLHTRRQEPSGEIPWRLKSETGAELVTVAWCKFYECLGRFPELVAGPKINSLHLCEAPGAFITSLNHYLYTTYKKNEIQWNWLATTLNPYYEGNTYNNMIIDDRFLLYTLDNWLFHKDFTGNIIDKENIKNMKEQCEQRLGNVNLITADGSIDCVESPDCQEEKVALLHYAEIISALIILADGGSFVMKMFTMYEASSVCKLYLLNCVFEKVNVFKPCTSKRGNSELYVVCLNYKKHTKNLNEVIEQMNKKFNLQDTAWPLFAKSMLPIGFLRQHETCCRMFMSYQIYAIEKNIYTYEVKPHKAVTKRLQSLRKCVCDEFYKRYNIQKLPNELKILNKFHNNIENNYECQIYKGSHSERLIFKKSIKEEQIFKLRKQLNELEKMFKEHAATNEFQLQFESDSENNIKLSLSRGMSIGVLNSSLFVNARFIIMRNNLNELYEFESSDCLWLNQPRLEFNQGSFTTKIKFNDFSLCSSFSEQQENFFKSVISALLKSKPNEIKFINMPFLTHYAVSILRYFSSLIYKKLTISLDTNFEIILSTCSENFIYNLEELKNSLFSSLDQNILCFLKIPQLHRNEFNKTLCTYNNMLLLQKYKYILTN